MIESIKTLLQARAEFKVVELASDLDRPPDFENGLPEVTVAHGKTTFAPSSADNVVIQAATKQVVIMLTCEASQVEVLENLVIQTVLGYQHTPEYDAMVAVSSDTFRLGGFFYTRLMVFETGITLEES